MRTHLWGYSSTGDLTDSVQGQIEELRCLFHVRRSAAMPMPAPMRSEPATRSVMRAKRGRDASCAARPARNRVKQLHRKLDDHRSQRQDCDLRDDCGVRVDELRQERSEEQECLR